MKYFPDVVGESWREKKKEIKMANEILSDCVVARGVAGTPGPLSAVLQHNPGS